LPRNNGCAKPTPLYMEFCQTLKLWWQNERGLTNWSHEASTPEGVPLPSYRYERETKSCTELSLRRNNSDTRVRTVRQNRLAMWPARKW